MGFGELLVWWLHQGAERVAHLTRAWELCYLPSLTLCPLHLFHLAVLNCILYNKQVIVNNMPSSVLWVIPENYQNWVGESWEPLIYSHLARSVPHNLGFVTVFWKGGGQSCGTETLICEIYANAKVLVAELNWIMGQLVGPESWRTGWCGEKPTHIVGIF